jgi:hypothetical protein
MVGEKAQARPLRAMPSAKHAVNSPIGFELVPSSAAAVTSIGVTAIRISTPSNSVQTLKWLSLR